MRSALASNHALLRNGALQLCGESRRRDVLTERPGD
jgi:hypothetical protein